MRQYFPQITDADLTLKRKTGENVWTNTIQWARMKLVQRGCIDNSSRGVWAITPAGKKWLEQEWHGASADYSKVTKPPLMNKRPSKRKAKTINDLADVSGPDCQRCFTETPSDDRTRCRDGAPRPYRSALPEVAS